MTLRVSSPAFVGRGRELERVSAALDQAGRGQPAVFLVGGEAGVGKTRFVAEIASRARGSGLRVLEGGCVQVGTQGLPFGPFIEALRGLADQTPQGELDDLLGAGRAELARLMPQFLRTGETARVVEDDPTGQSRLFEHMLLLLGRLADRSPVLLIVEDLHWADRSTLELLTFLIRNVRGRPIVLAASYRSDELHRRHPLLPFLAEQERAGRTDRIELRRFDWPELSAQLRAILGRDPDPELVERVMVRSQGNAFYAEELLAGGASDGPLPDTLREVLLARVANLTEPVQAVVRIASAGGARISADVLAAVAETERRQLESALGDAIAQNILVAAEGPDRERYAFRHALVQEAVYAELLPGVRSRLHAAFAHALSDAGDALADGARAAELADHWQAAHDLPRAFDAWLAAGIGAERLFATAEAAACFDHALELWDKVPDADARAPIDRVEVLTRAARATRGAAPSRSIEYLRTAIGFVDSAEDPIRSGLLYEMLGHGLGIAMNHEGALAAYEEGVRLVRADPPSAARVQVLAGLGTYLAHNHRFAEAAALCAQALDVSAAAGVQAVWAMIPLGFVRVVLGDVEHGFETLRVARATAAGTGRAFEAARAEGWLVLSLLEAERFQDAALTASEAEPWAVRHGLGALWGVNNANNGARALLALGHWDAAADALTRASQYKRFAKTDSRTDEEFALLEALRGQFDSAAQRLARRPAYSPTVHDEFIYAAAPAELALWSREPLAAREALQPSLKRPPGETQPSVRNVSMILALALRAEADLAVSARARRSDEDTDDAYARGTDALARMRALVDEVQAKRPYYVPMATASLALCEAEFTRLEGRSDPDAWASAAMAFAGQPYLCAYALTREGEAALSGPRDRARAEGALDEARLIATRLGARPLLLLIQTLATVAGPTRQATGPARAESRGRFDLSPRELEVLALLALGRSDGDIADVLFISKKTASVHVTNIKGKLGAQSRIEIVTTAIALGLVHALPTAEM